MCVCPSACINVLPCVIAVRCVDVCVCAHGIVRPPRSLGFQDGVTITGNYSAGSAPVLLDGVECFGGELAIDNCVHNVVSWGARACCARAFGLVVMM